MEPRDCTGAMVDPDKAVFISYRRKLSPFVARSIFENLTNHGYDVFMDVESIDSGNFETIILHQIAARTHFLAVLTPGSLEPTSEPGDWLRREIEYAIKLKRNVVPVITMGFEFSKEAENFPQRRLPGGVEALRGFNGIDVPHNYFDDAMRRLRERFLKKPTAIAITPAPKIELTDVKRKIGKVVNLVPDQSILSSFGLKPSPFSKIPWFTLNAPTLSIQHPLLLLPLLQWTTVPGATSYLLEGSPPSSDPGYIELYKGEKTEFELFPVVSVFSAKRNFRVKAENKVLSVESPWSNVVTSSAADPPTMGVPRLEDLFLHSLSAPVLGVDVFGLETFESTKFRWTAVPGAHSYVLEKSGTEAFSHSLEVYRGANTYYIVTSFHHNPALRLEFTISPYYRVRAIGISPKDASPWSNVVQMNPSNFSSEQR